MYKKKENTQPKVITLDRVKSYMTWMIGRYGDYSSKTLMQKANLCFKDDKQFNELALNYMIEHGIVDDARYAERLTLSFADQNIGVGKIKEKLYKKGFSSSVISDCISNLETSDEDYLSKALILKNRKFGIEPIVDQKLKTKALRHLIAKGFSYSIANEAISYIETH